MRTQRHINWERVFVNKYNHLLVTLVLLLVFSPTLSASRQEYRFPVISLILMIVLVAAMRTNFPHGRFLYFFLGVVSVGFVVDLCIYYLPENYRHFGDLLSFINQLVTCFFFALTVTLLTRSLFRTRQVSQDTIKGAVCAYLLLGFFWSILYALTETLFPNSIVSLSGEPLRYVYFSFTTLTTVGYGDIVPVGQLASVLATLEAVSGQIFLAVLVARLVGLYIANETNSRRE